MEQLDDAIGMFAKTLTLRTSVQEKLRVNEILNEVREDILLLHENQDGHSEIGKTFFDVLAVFQNPDFTHEGNRKFEETELFFIPQKLSKSRLPLLFNFYEKGNTLHAVISYDTSRYESTTIEIIASKFLLLLKQIVQDPLQKIEDLEFLMEFERKEVMDIDLAF